MPRVDPSAELLRFHGAPIPTWICEEHNALWNYYEPEGGPIPKPDYTVGLSPYAFSCEEVQLLENYSTPKNPFRFTPNLCFPFLTCEAKSGDQAVSQAQSQNISNGSIAVGAIIELYKAAFGQSELHRVTELYDKVLAFTVFYDNVDVTLWVYHATLNGMNKEKFQYHQITAFSLTRDDGIYLDKAYSLVRNIFE